MIGLCIFCDDQDKFADSGYRLKRNSITSNPPLKTGCPHPGYELRLQEQQTPLTIDRIDLIVRSVQAAEN